MAEKSEDKYTIDQDTSASITITFDFDVLVFWRCHIQMVEKSEV